MSNNSNTQCTPLSMQLCNALDKRTHPEANTRKHGFDVLILTSLKTGKEKWYGVVYRQASNDKGVLINNCPFCGADFTTAHNGISL